MGHIYMKVAQLLSKYTFHSFIIYIIFFTFLLLREIHFAPSIVLFFFNRYVYSYRMFAILKTVCLLLLMFSYLLGCFSPDCTQYVEKKKSGHLLRRSTYWNLSVTYRFLNGQYSKHIGKIFIEKRYE